MVSETKLNQKNLALYTELLAKDVCESYFANSERVTGNELKTFSPIKQVNLFLLMNLFTEWQKETANLKSPWFDYSDEQVKQALQSFMNVLSLKISIERENFEPLLQKSASDALFLALKPEEFFESWAESWNQTYLDASELEAFKKYFSYHKEVFLHIIGVIKEKGFEEISKGVFETLCHDAVAANVSTLNTDEVIAAFCEVRYFDTEYLFEPEFVAEAEIDEVIEDSVEIEITKVETEPVAVNSLFDEISDDDMNSEVLNEVSETEELHSIYQEFENEAPKTLKDILAEANEQEAEPSAKVVLFEIEHQPVINSVEPAADVEPLVNELIGSVLPEVSIDDFKAIEEVETPVAEVSDIVTEELDIELNMRPLAKEEETYNNAKEKYDSARIFLRRSDIDESKIKPVVVKGHPNKNISHTVYPTADLDEVSTVKSEIAPSLPTLLDNLRGSSEAISYTETYAETAVKVNSIAEAISVGLRFKLIQELFKGNEAALVKALEEFDSMTSAYEVINHINNTYYVAYEWDFESDTVKSLVDIINRKFGANS